MRAMTKIVYVLTNPAIPDLVKIGVTSRQQVMKRISELSRQTGVPLPFQCYFAGEVSNHADNVEHLVHKAFAKSRVPSGKEFFAIEPDQAVAALKLANANDVTPQFQTTSDAYEDEGIKLVKRTRRAKTFLKDLGIHSGTKLMLSRGRNIFCTVVDPDQNKVRFAGEILSLSAAAVEALRKLGYKTPAASGTAYWMYNGETLGRLRHKRGKTNLE